MTSTTLVHPESHAISESNSRHNVKDRFKVYDPDTREWVDTSAKPEGKNITWEIPDENGDTKCVWDDTKPADVEGASTLYDFMTKEKNHAAHITNYDGTIGPAINEFDPKLRELTFIGRMVGG